MRLGIRVEILSFDPITDNNLVFGLLILQDLLQDPDFLTSRHIDLKEEGFLGFRIAHEQTRLYFEIWLERVPDHWMSRELYPDHWMNRYHLLLSTTSQEETVSLRTSPPT